MKNQEFFENPEKTRNRGDRGGIRTLDPLIKSQVLYRLSYAVFSRWLKKTLHLMKPNQIRQVFVFISWLIIPRKSGSSSGTATPLSRSLYKARR